MRFPTMWYVRPAKAQISLRIVIFYAQSDQSICSSLDYTMTVKLLTENHFGVSKLKRRLYKLV